MDCCTVCSVGSGTAGKNTAQTDISANIGVCVHCNISKLASFSGSSQILSCSGAFLQWLENEVHVQTSSDVWGTRNHVVRWLGSGHVMIMQQSCDGHVTVMWWSCDIHVMIKWVMWWSSESCDIHVMIMWQSCDDHVTFMWSSESCDDQVSHVTVMWWSSDSHVMVMWQSCDGQVTVMWWSGDSHVMVKWQSCDRPCESFGSVIMGIHGQPTTVPANSLNPVQYKKQSKLI